MAANRLSETARIVVSGAAAFATFQGAQGIYLVSDTDCFVDFDQPAVTTRSMLLKANLQPVYIDFHGGSVMKVYGITTGAGGNLYVLAVYN